MTDQPFEIIGANRPGRWLVSCDHATNLVPDWVHGGDLGLPAAEMARHIAYDIGAAGVTRHLAQALDCPAILSRFSRLVCDPNRGEDDPTIMMRLYDGTIIPANRNADEAEKEERLRRLYRPYHAAYADLANKIANPVICAVHSFTPRLQGRAPRPWEIGVLYADDARLALPFMAACRAQGWCTGDNQPYAGHLPGDAVDRHALQHGRPNLLIEIRQDLIEDEAGQILWASRLAPLLADVLAQSGL
ncbi:MAG: N-formylglutamate amidohydrolase [Yoonia sp.]|uniref:N-formylglutamate amidohydrolase n=1 Tax=Yoonia sp. TaxID=2212373 RepID=UPI00273D8B1E|nr:N-formylglutamate amidohydrolase [Yoonia sp.]MDP5085942.1 N-formylglutamate amidohydrolase [Yoonia sp.]